MSDDEEQDEPEGAEAAPEAAEAEAEAEAPEPAQADSLATLLRYARPVVPLVWLACVVAAGWTSGIELAFLVLAGGVLVAVISLMWLSVQSLTGSAALGFEEALGMGAPSKVEEQKRAVLRALKDLEYERGVGKISLEDYAELSAKYRAEAKQLIQSVDETLAPARKEVERALDRKLAKAGLASPEQPADAAKDAPDAAKDAPAAEAETPAAEADSQESSPQPEPPSADAEERS